MMQMVRILARFVRHADNNPLTGDQYTAKLWDKDFFVDDHLGTRKLDAKGGVEFTFDVADAGSADSPMEMYPDLYLVLLEDGKEVFRSKVFGDVDFLSRDPVSGESSRLTQNLGTFKI